MEKYFKVSESELRDLLITAIKWQHFHEIDDAKYWEEKDVPTMYDLLEKVCLAEGLTKLPGQCYFGYDDLVNHYLNDYQEVEP